MTNDQIAAFVKAFPEHDVPHWSERDRFIFQGWQSRQIEIDALKEEVEKLRKDADRYRFMRSTYTHRTMRISTYTQKPAFKFAKEYDGLWYGSYDDAIDAAMKEPKQ